MDKAEERALEAYPKAIRDIDGIAVDIGHPQYMRDLYIEGYHQAEKDLELSWEDMMLIHKCIKDAMNYHLYKMMEGMEGQKIVYEEVLKRFLKERKKK